MFTRTLLPTDGSEQCRKTIDDALELARAVGCRLTAYTCIEEFSNMAYSVSVGECPHAYYMGTVQGYAKECTEHTTRHVREEGVQFDSDVPQFVGSYLDILDMAKRHMYDVISMTSHGYRSPMGRSLIDNETCKVLTYADVSVVAYH